MSDYFVHESSYVDEPCKIGRGTKIWHFSHIMKDSELGENCNIGQSVVISPGVRLGKGVKVQNSVLLCSGVICEDEVFIGHGSQFTNVINPRAFIERKNEYKTTIIKKGASIGANVSVICGHTIGRYAFVGAGSVVTKDVPDYTIVYGNPARIHGYVCKCGTKLPDGDTPVCEACGDKYRLENGTMKKDSR